jgi:DNA-binding CsgD family transcriptional regulator
MTDSYDVRVDGGEPRRGPPWPYPTKAAGLTPRQAEVLAYLKAYSAERGYMPCFEEIAERFSFRSLATVHEHVTNLERKGHIRREVGAVRGITLCSEDQSWRDFAQQVRDGCKTIRDSLDRDGAMVVVERLDMLARRMLT